MAESGQRESNASYFLEKFYFFKTISNFYMVGRDKGKKHWRVLKIDRSEPSELIMHEDPTIYSYPECKSLLQGITEGNKQTGGCKLVTKCYGIVGFIRFFGPYYIILITKRRKIGEICGHPIYAISGYKIIPIHHSTVLSYMDDFEREDRYKKLLCSVNIKKDFFFSYSYPIMHSLQKNLCQQETGELYDGNMFVWNEYLTRQVQHRLKNTLWTVALVHGFFKQVKLSNSGTSFGLTLIARRSRHFAGTRFQKRGVNDMGDAANDVEIEQIVCGDIHGGCSYKITSSVQNRGSIPLAWSQKHGFLNVRPRIKLSSRNRNNSYLATRLHFIKHKRRYGRPIIILNLVKKHGQECRLSDEFRKAIDRINMVLTEEDQFKYKGLDLNTVYRIKRAGVLKDLKEHAAHAMEKIEFFSCQIPEFVEFNMSMDFSDIRSSVECTYSQKAETSEKNNCNKLQKGILRINCIDSLDRTNVAQYAYGLVALGHQLHTLAINQNPNLDLNHALSCELMGIYEAMGDALAHQYGGSAAQNKIFAEYRGQCEFATTCLEFLKKVQRHFSNSFRDVDKQKGIDIFLGNFLGLTQREVDESPKSRSNSHKPMLLRTASDSDIFSKMSAPDLEYMSCSVISTPRWCAPVGQLHSDVDSPNIGSPYFGGTHNYFTDNDAAPWSESELDRVPFQIDHED